jgi:3-dehydroquinate dehydratase-2
VLNGPNLIMLGVREPAVYGLDDDDVRRRTEARAKTLDLSIDFRQSNLEGELVTWIQEAREAASGISSTRVPIPTPRSPFSMR